MYTVLVDGDDFNEPVADAARSILDGHIVLSRKLASAGHFPSIDVLESKSRVRDQVADPELRRAADRLLSLESAYRETEDLILVGAYQRGSRPQVDISLQLRDPMLNLLRQRPDEASTLDQTRDAFTSVAKRADALASSPVAS